MVVHDGARFELSGLVMGELVPGDRAGLVAVSTRTTGTRPALLGPEAQRAAWAWLEAFAGPHQVAHDPDAVRLAIDEACADLRQRLRDGQLDDGLTALSWFQHHLDEIAAAAAGTVRPS